MYGQELSTGMQEEAFARFFDRNVNVTGTSETPSAPNTANYPIFLPRQQRSPRNEMRKSPQSEIKFIDAKGNPHDVAEGPRTSEPKVRSKYGLKSDGPIGNDKRGIVHILVFYVGSTC
jgi:hypothetical protein